MILIVAVSVFFATAAGAFGLYWILDYRRESLHQRFKEVVGKVAATDEGVVESAGKWLNWFRGRFTAKPVVETDLVDMLSGKELEGARLLLNQAGYRSPGAYHTYILVRWALPLLAVVLSLIGGKFTGLENRSIFLAILIAGIVGFLLPDFALRRMILKRQEQITDSLPDGLDLLVVCVEAGLGLNAAFVKITEEFRLSSPALSEEFDIVNREMVAGKPRQCEALFTSGPVVSTSTGEDGKFTLTNVPVGSNVPLWILGSSLFGAQVAAALGLPFAFASHFAPAMLMEARDEGDGKTDPGAAGKRHHGASEAQPEPERARPRREQRVALA